MCFASVPGKSISSGGRVLEPVSKKGESMWCKLRGAKHVVQAGRYKLYGASCTAQVPWRNLLVDAM
eukprot:2807243-Pyramimonas_sp.AAC.1